MQKSNNGLLVFQQSYFKKRHLCEDCGTLCARLGQHSCEHIIKTFTCNLCGQRLATEFALKVHALPHSYTFKCKYSSVSVHTMLEKVKQEKTHGKQEKPYKCPHCSGTFVSHSARKEHMILHRGSSQWQCDICQSERTLHRAHRSQSLQV